MAVAEAPTGRAAAGLDSLELPVRVTKRPLSRRIAAVALPKLAALAVVLLLWELVVLSHIEPDYIIPSPLDVLRGQQSPFGLNPGLIQEWQNGTILTAIWSSVSHAVIGYALAVAVGTPFGLALGRVPALRTAVGSLISALQTLPSVVWVPFAIVIFGLSSGMLYFVVIMGSFPSVVNGMKSAVDQVQPLLIRVGRSMGASGPKLWRHVIIPAAMPGYVAGLRQAWAFSWRSLMAAEIVATSVHAAGNGLGTIVEDGGDTNSMTLVITGILLILLVGLAADALVFNPLDRIVRQRRGLIAEDA